MATTNNITTSTVTINNYPSTYLNIETESSISTKSCTKCHQIKQLIEFYKNKTSKDGYHTQCKTCKDNNKNEYVKNNKEKVAKQQK